MRAQAQFASKPSIERFLEDHSKEFVKCIVQSPNELVVRLDHEGRYTFVNRAYCQKMGKSRAHLIGTEFTPYVHPDDLIRVQRALKALRSPPYRASVEHRSLFLDGWRWTHWEGYAVRDRKGRIREIQGIGRDITDQKITEMALNRQALVFENMTDSVLMTDAEGKIIDSNPAATNMFGLSAKELHGRSPLEFLFDPPLTIKNALEAPQSLQTRLSLEVRFKRDREIGLSVVTAVPLKGQRGLVYAIVLIFRDISAEKAMQESLKEHQRTLTGRIRELARINGELEQFAFVISHDLREPLRMISNFIELSLRTLNPIHWEESMRHLGLAHESALRMQRMIRDLEIYTRLGASEMPKEVVDLLVAFTHAKSNLKSLIDETGAVVEVLSPLPTVKANMTLIIDVFQNLLDNALKFRRQGIAPIVQLHAVEQSEGWSLKFSDNGIGIDSQFQKKIFQLFQRLHTQTQYPGRGLGLAIVKKVLEGLGASVALDSSSGTGATFVLNFPHSICLPFSSGDKA